MGERSIRIGCCDLRYMFLMAPISGAMIHLWAGSWFGLWSLLSTVPHQTRANRAHMVYVLCIYIMEKSLPSNAVRWLLDFSTFENYTVAAFIISLAFFFFFAIDGIR